jgi:hypothetical protein
MNVPDLDHLYSIDESTGNRINKETGEVVGTIGFGSISGIAGNIDGLTFEEREAMEFTSKVGKVTDDSTNTRKLTFAKLLSLYPKTDKRTNIKRFLHVSEKIGTLITDFYIATSKNKLAPSNVKLLEYNRFLESAHNPLQIQTKNHYLLYLAYLNRNIDPHTESAKLTSQLQPTIDILNRALGEENVKSTLDVIDVIGYIDMIRNKVLS